MKNTVSVGRTCSVHMQRKIFCSFCRNTLSSFRLVKAGGVCYTGIMEPNFNKAYKSRLLLLPEHSEIGGETGGSDERN